MKNWRLGLDLGTNSIGWSVIELDSKNEPTQLVNMGVRIFSDGRDPKSKEPLAVARRTARGIRRNIYRRKQRRRKLFKILQEQRLYPQKREDAQKLKSLDPYELRVKALDHILEPNELGRVLFHLGVRRGFKSNRKELSEEKSDLEKVVEKKDISKMSQTEKILGLTEELKASGYRTLGEFLYIKKNQLKGARFVPERSVFYPLRAMYEEEFYLIKKKQETKYKKLDWEALHNAIFYQRPLKPQERGKCQFLTTNPRTFKAVVSSNKFRILQEVYNLVIYDDENKPVILDSEKTERLIDLLDTKDKMSFDAIRKALKITGRFNLESDNRTELKGNDTSRKMRMAKHFGKLWDELSLEKQDDIIELLITADEDEEVFKALEKFDLSDEQKNAIAKLVFATGTTNLCKEITQALVQIMSTKKLQYHEAIAVLGYSHSDQKVDEYDILPYYGKVLIGSTMGGDIVKYSDDEPEKKYGKIGNPTVHVALNQLRVVTNSLIKEYGKPRQISIELSRDLKASRDDKAKMLKRQAENTRRNAIFNESIKQIHKGIQFPGRFERLKFKLYEELGNNSPARCCLYCGKTISASELFTSNIEIEHILPFSRTLLDAESNLTIAHKQCNAIKREKTPWEAFGNNPKGYNWQDIMGRVALLKSKSKQARFAQDAIDVFEKDSGFIARQLTDNAYLSRISLRYLKSICKDVWAVSGGMTKLLRDKWELDSCLKKDSKELSKHEISSEKISEYKKNRYDHRHHALDSMVIGVLDRSLVQEISRLNAISRKNKLEAPPLPFRREDIMDFLKGMVISFKPDHGIQGKLSKETLLGKIRQEELINIEKLEEEDIKNIKVDKVREEFQKLFEECKKKSEVRKKLKDIYPQVKVFKEYYVARTAITALKNPVNISDIVDGKIRKELRQFVEKRPDEKFEAVLAEYSEKTGIKKIRCKVRIQTPIMIKANEKNPLSVPRYLNPEDYFTAIIWELPPAKEGKEKTYQAQYVLRTELDKQGKPIDKKPHPAAKKICLLHKDDYIEFSESGIWKKARIAGFSTTRNSLDIRPIFASGSVKDWLNATQHSLVEKGWKEIDGSYFVSVNVLFGKQSARKITVNPIGRVFRKSK